MATCAGCRRVPAGEREARLIVVESSRCLIPRIRHMAPRTDRDPIRIGKLHAVGVIVRMTILAFGSFDVESGVRSIFLVAFVARSGLMRAGQRKR